MDFRALCSAGKEIAAATLKKSRLRDQPKKNASYSRFDDEMTATKTGSVRPTSCRDWEIAMVCDTHAIREIIAKHGRLSTDVSALNETSDLYFAGLTSLATVGVMLALEDHFNIEFPTARLSRKTFESMATIAEAIAELRG